MEAVSLMIDKFTQYYSPTHDYMGGLQGDWIDSDYYSRGEAMNVGILGEKEETYEEGK